MRLYSLQGESLLRCVPRGISGDTEFKSIKELAKDMRDNSINYDEDVCYTLVPPRPFLKLVKEQTFKVIIQEEETK